MSNAILKGNASGTGSVTLESPNTNSDRTIALPDADGTIAFNNQLGMRNRIINGAMVIDQRNAGASVTPTDASYTLDRWKAYLSQSSKYTVQQNAGSVAPPVGFVNYLGVTSSSAYTVGSSERFAIVQQIEGLNTGDLGWGTANAKTVTLSFQVYSSLTGTFGGSITNSAYNRSYPFTYTVSSVNTWTTISVTVAGDTSGTWLTTNGVGIQVWFGLGVGSTYSGTAGSWSGSTYLSATGATSVVGTSGATFYITGVQLEVGSSATGFEYRQYQQELALCQRYLPAFSGAGNRFIGMATSTTAVSGAVVNFPVTPRVAPTGITISAASQFSVTDIITQNAAASAVTFGSAGTASATLNATCTGLTSGRPTYIYQNAAGSLLLFNGCEL